MPTTRARTCPRNRARPAPISVGRFDRMHVVELRLCTSLVNTEAHKEAPLGCLASNAPWLVIHGNWYERFPCQPASPLLSSSERRENAYTLVRSRRSDLF